MDNAVCLSQYFVNKQNVRSFGNIMKTNILKSPDQNIFTKLVFDDSVSELTEDLKQIFQTFRRNLKKHCKDDFKIFFPMDNAPNLNPVNKEFIFNNCWKALNEVIPKQFYGNNANSKIFKNLIETVIYSMKRQNFILEKIIRKWDYSATPWKTLSGNSRNQMLYDIVLWICKYVLSSMICLNFYVTTCKLDANENKLYYFWKNHWQSFYDTQISKMVFTRVIKRLECYSLGRKTKKRHSTAERMKLKALKKNVPKLYLTLKTNNVCRPIVCYKNNSLNALEKYKVKERLKFLRFLIGKPQIKLENQYITLYINWLKVNKPKLYFVKTDLSNAFGCINREKLSKIMSQRYMNVLKAEKCLNKRKKIAQQYKDMLSELRKPLLIRAGSTIYEWKEGLIQGYKYSPALSELYYMTLDEVYFNQHMKHDDNSVKLFIRVVDDYLYITDSLQDAQSFLTALSNYRNVNYEKTVINFPHENIKYSEEISFLGYSYNSATLQVSRGTNIYYGQMCYKIAFTGGISNMYKFIDSRVGQSGIQINSHIFNFLYNSEESIWRHVFTTYCLSSNKFCSILAVLCDEQEIEKYLSVYKKRVTVRLTNSIIVMLMKNKPQDLFFMYCINHFRYLSWKALYLCAKMTPKCTGLVPFVNIELAKSNCIFGKWREHASRIDVSGEPQRQSIKKICRRTDLRQLFKEFDTLPPGFECYHHKKRM